MSELTWSDLAKLVSDVREKYPHIHYRAIIKPGIYRYIRMRKYHKWDNKFLLWEAAK